MRRAAASVLLAACLAVPSRAFAYRPFDGTDADVAEQGSFELELGPAHWYYQSGQDSLHGHYLIAPATVLNLGILEDTELVVEFANFVALGPLDGRPAASLLETDVLLKHVFREGSLQGKSGPSFAIEAGPLTPEINGSNAFGASLDAIVSYAWRGGAIHFDERPSYTRDHTFDVFSGAILEGPHDWVVRPVCEIFYETEPSGSGTQSVLVGAIWTAKESFVVDLGLRGARIGEDRAAEVRLGFTWSLPIWDPGARERAPAEPAPSRAPLFPGPMVRSTRAPPL
ncbi:MAG: hypothetical protein ACRENE_10455 [Polyangiaceae bacterium]